MAITPDINYTPIPGLALTQNPLAVPSGASLRQGEAYRDVEGQLNPYSRSHGARARENIWQQGAITDLQDWAVQANTLLETIRNRPTFDQQGFQESMDRWAQGLQGALQTNYAKQQQQAEVRDQRLSDAIGQQGAAYSTRLSDAVGNWGYMPQNPGVQGVATLNELPTGQGNRTTNIRKTFGRGPGSLKTSALNI